MRLEFAIFCEAAQVLPDGLINMLRGGYDIIFTPAFPAVTNRMMAIVRFWCDEDEVDRPHSLVPQIVDPTGHLLPLDMTLPVYPTVPPF